MIFSTGKRVLLIALIILAVGVGLLLMRDGEPEPIVPIAPITLTPVKSVIGYSVLRRPIEAYTYGSGTTHLVFVGGVHGGYEWNSVVLAYEFMDYLTANPALFPSDMKVSVIPNANPDGVFKVVGKEGRFAAADVPADVSTAPGRFNANGVDLNRNFDCKWKPESTWRGATVSAGTKAFSEPEALALRDFMLKARPTAAVFWHSQANAVYASECTAGILPETLTVMNTYAKAAGYAPVDSFDAYEITGDVEGWLASIGIPAVTVELSSHETIEWEKNLAGVKALFGYYGK